MEIRLQDYRRCKGQFDNIVSIEMFEAVGEHYWPAYFACLAILLTIAVGVSRVYLGVHFASDVLAGWCIGSAWALLCWTVASWLRRG